jgi:hypothetical protein
MGIIIFFFFFFLFILPHLARKARDGFDELLSEGSKLCGVGHGQRLASLAAMAANRS